jgi:23S rRNA (pseudouridine1915-N3)-methyltransferase
MKITLAAILPKTARAKAEPTDRLIAEYVNRTNHYLYSETQLFDAESALLGWLTRQPGRTRAYTILLDSHGRQLTSEDFAARLGRLRDDGTQHLVLAIGPADGWSPSARERADLLLSLGLITLPHQLARVVIAEQVYRAFTILAGHPYHSGH